MGMYLVMQGRMRMSHIRGEKLDCCGKSISWSDRNQSSDVVHLSAMEPSVLGSCLCIGGTIIELCPLNEIGDRNFHNVRGKTLASPFLKDFHTTSLPFLKRTSKKILSICRSGSP